MYSCLQRVRSTLILLVTVGRLQRTILYGGEYKGTHIPHYVSKELQTLELNREPYPSEVDEADDMELATAAEKKNLKKKNELPGGEGMGQSNSLVQSCIIGFQRFIEKWEPKFEEWDQKMKGVEGRDVGQSPLQYGGLEGKNVPAKLSNTRKPAGDDVECDNTVLCNSY
jgi:hypothetical protein